MTHMTTSKLREDLADALNRVAYGGERIMLQRRGKDVAALVSKEDLALLEALEERSDVEAAGKALEEPGRIAWEATPRGGKVKRLFIIGAGFSHALAGLPLGKDIANLIFEYARSTSPRNRRLRDIADNYRRVWDYLQDQAKPLIDFLQTDGTQIETLTESAYPINMEYLLTLLDLNLTAPYVPKGIGVDLQGCPIPYIKGFNNFILEEARQFIQHSMYELVGPASYDGLDKDRLHKMVSLVSEGDAIITFNYDLLIEQGLIMHDLWNPVDGYGVGELCEHEQIISDLHSTKVDLIKLHGSINWSKGSQIVVSPDVVVHAADFDNKCFFSGLKVESKHPPYHMNYPRNSLIIMPTYLKLFNRPFEVGLASRAFDAARSADEVYLMGYSLPKADVTANNIISRIRRSAKFFIVNSNDAENIRNRLIETYGFDSKNIVYERSDVVKWIDNDFKYLQYQKDQEDIRVMQSILDASAG